MTTGSTQRSRETTLTTTTTTTTKHYFWERRPAGALPWVIGAVGLLGLGIAHDIPIRHSIEQDLEGRAATALADTPGVKVDFTGRDGVLTGTLPADADPRTLIEKVTALDGVRVVTANFGTGTDTGATTPSPSPAAPSPSSPASGPSAAASLPAVTAVTAGGKVTLSGTVPTQAAKDALVAAATTTFGAGNVVDQLTVDAAVSDQGLSGFATLLGALGEPSAATAALKDGALTLSGTVADAAAKTAAEAAAAAVTQDAGKVTSQLTVGATPAPSNPGKPAGGPAQQKLDTLPQITFETGTTRLTPAGLRAVRQAAAILKANPAVKVRIDGHTDDIGSAASNLRLSTARAAKVRQVLHSLGIAHERMSYRGFGEGVPKLANTSPTNRAVNRRVEFLVL
ncbi:MAG: OmpA family protein [Kineosporiaceae bacterium]|nr:OmpA family protein [Kineosporiaceae bacterium]MBK7623065.1 OmpA family protein [Kineosporiaceae bacterium]